MSMSRRSHSRGIARRLGGREHPLCTTRSFLLCAFDGQRYSRCFACQRREGAHGGASWNEIHTEPCGGFDVRSHILVLWMLCVGATGLDAQRVWQVDRLCEFSMGEPGAWDG